MRIVMLDPPGAARERRQLCFPTRFLLILRRRSVSTVWQGIKGLHFSDD